MSFILFSVFTKSRMCITTMAGSIRTEVRKECNITEEGDECQEGREPRGESPEKHDEHARNEAHDQRGKCHRSSCKCVNARECGYWSAVGHKPMGWMRRPRVQEDPMVTPPMEKEYAWPNMLRSQHRIRWKFFESFVPVLIQTH
jgi:hypothetical protein